MPLQVGTTIAFDIRATSGTGAALAVSVAGCEPNVRVDNRTGAGSPYRAPGAMRESSGAAGCGAHVHRI